MWFDHLPTCYCNTPLSYPVHMGEVCVHSRTIWQKWEEKRDVGMGRPPFNGLCLVYHLFSLHFINWETVELSIYGLMSTVHVHVQIYIGAPNPGTLSLCIPDDSSRGTGFFLLSIHRSCVSIMCYT